MAPCGAGAAGLLKVKGRVNEIFGGIGLGFVAQAFATYLIIGPWKRSGVASTSGTEPFRPETWLPTAFDTRLAPIAIGLAVAMLIGVGSMMRGTRFGLRLAGGRLESGQRPAARGPRRRHDDACLPGRRWVGRVWRAP